jgi:TrmH family RNA methyltransferase
MIYTSTENKKIKEIKKLNQKKYRDISHKFLVEGEHLVKEAYETGLLDELYITDDVSVDFDIPTFTVSDTVLKYISDLDTPQKMIGVCSFKMIGKIGNHVLVLDGIQDPGNLGTIIRSSVAFGVDTIIMGNNCVDLYNSKVIRATQGMLFHIDIVCCDLIPVLTSLKSDGYFIVGTDVNDGNEIKTIEKKSRFAIIMGNEGNGISKSVKNLCDSFIYIKMNQACESLNVGVAASIILYELYK